MKKILLFIFFPSVFEVWIELASVNWQRSVLFMKPKSRLLQAIQQLCIQLKINYTPPLVVEQPKEDDDDDDSSSSSKNSKETDEKEEEDQLLNEKKTESNQKKKKILIQRKL